MALEFVTGRIEDLCFAARRVALGPYRVRRTQLFCLGAAKTGTHSIAQMFSRNVRARHEAEASEVMQRILDWRAGRISESQMRTWARARDRKLALEVDSSLLNFDMLAILLKEFPDARYLLTIRDCYSWLNSMANHKRRFKDKVDPLWEKMREVRFGPGPDVYAPEEQPLKERGSAPLDKTLSFWARRTEMVLASVPPERLLVVRTDQITPRAFEIADFAGLPRRAIRLRRTHAFRNPAKHDLLHQIDRQFLEQKVEQHCRAVMNRFFPEIKSLDDAKL